MIISFRWVELYIGDEMLPIYMDVSLNGGTPQIIHFNRVFHYKPSILGYPYFWKHPYMDYFIRNLFGFLLNPPRIQMVHVTFLRVKSFLLKWLNRANYACRKRPLSWCSYFNGGRFFSPLELTTQFVGCFCKLVQVFISGISTFMAVLKKKTPPKKRPGFSV